MMLRRRTGSSPGVARHAPAQALAVALALAAPGIAAATDAAAGKPAAAPHATTPKAAAPYAAASASSDIRVLQPTSLETPGGSTNGVVYMTIHNIGAAADRLVGASTPLAASVEIHGTSMKAGVMQMRPLAGVDIASGGDAEFVSSGMHLMLIGLKHPLKRGESFPLTLKFRKAGDRTVSVTVGAFGARRPIKVQP